MASFDNLNIVAHIEEMPNPLVQLAWILFGLLKNRLWDTVLQADDSDAVNRRPNFAVMECLRLRVPLTQPLLLEVRNEKCFIRFHLKHTSGDMAALRTTRIMCDVSPLMRSVQP